jgi:transcriptional regulator GlxA family with amidase domain
MANPKPRRVLILAPAPAQLLDLAGPAEVFAQASSNRPGGYTVDVAIIAGARGLPATGAGVSLGTNASLKELLADRRPLDTLIVGGGEGARTRDGELELRHAVRRLSRRARRTVSVCTGAFILAAAGLLDGRRATTHWRWGAELARRYPKVKVDPEPIFTRDGDLWTSAGITAGMDLALALVEEDHGHPLALAIARELVMFLRRPGGQGQFSATLAAQSTPTTAPGHDMRDLVAWMADNVHKPLTVETLAERAHLSPRQFARVFRRELGVPPGRMIDQMRIEAAKRRLEEAPQGLAAIAAACGFGAEETMRRSFLRHLGIPPGAYRERFRRPPLPAHQGVTP